MRRGPRGLLLALVLLALPGCSGGTAPSADRPGAAPARTGEVVEIDACDLAGRSAMRRALGEPVQVVGRELDPPTLPTESCLWGREFGVALVEVQVTPGPVAEDVFEAAYGPAAGDDPRAAAVGEAAYTRSGLTSRTLQVYDHGAVLSLAARDSPGDRLPRGALADIARVALARLPANPVLADLPDAPPPCRRVDENAVAAAMRAAVRLRSAFVAARGPDSPAMCSWAGLPGQVVVTVRTDPVQVTNFRANLSPRVYERVPGVPAEAWSQTRHAGDLLVFVGGTLAEVTALPGTGFSSPEVATTSGEVRLARELVRVLR